MKKALVAVLVMLFCSNVGVAEIVLKNKIDLEALLIQTGLVLSYQGDNHTLEFDKTKKGTWNASGQSFPIVWEAISNNVFTAVDPKKKGDGPPSKIILDFNNMTATATDSDGSLINYKIVSPKKVITEEKKVEIASMIDEAKDTCKSLGFNEGTEKFSDCALKLYSQSVELAAKNNQQIVMQPQSSGSNVMTIYDPVRDSNALMDKGMKMITGRCTLGYNC